MKAFTYNQEKTELLNVVKAKAQKKSLNVLENQNKIQIFLKSEDFKNGEADIPVSFRGKLSEDENKTILKGHFVFGFYLYTMVIVAAIFILARFIWSTYKNQIDNMILCGVVAVVLLIVILTVNQKSKAAKKFIYDFLITLSK